MKKYKYTYEEWSQDTRSYEIESDKKLTRDEIQDIALSCDLVEGSTYEGGKEGDRFFAKYKGTEFGENAQTEFGGDEIEE